MHNFRRTTASTAIAAALIASATAQEPAPLVSDEIIVTGTKQNLTLQEAEVSVEVFNEERLERENLFDIDDVLLRTPNISTNGSTAAFSVRGIARNGVGGGQGVTSNVYLDGAPITQFALTYGFDTVWDVGQVEVLRGSQSTVQGRNALAGAVVLRTNDPTYEWEARLRGRYGDFETAQVAGVISGPIIEDQLAFRIAADYQTTDGFATNGFTGVDYNARENILLRGKLLAEPAFAPDLRVEMTVDYNNGESGPQSNRIFSNVPITDPEFANFDFNDYVSFIPQEITDIETVRLLTDITYDLTPNLTLHAIGTYEDNAYDRILGDPENPGQIDSPVNEDVINDGDATTYSAELRLEYAFDRWSGAFGAYYFEDEDTTDTVFFSPLINDVFFPIDPINTQITGSNFTLTETQNFAFYLQTRFELNDFWTFDFGIRYDNEEFATTGTQAEEPGVTPETCVAQLPDFVRDLLGFTTNSVSCLDLVLAATPPQIAPPLQTNTFDPILPRGAITFNFNEDLAVFFSGQRGYRAGGAFILPTAEALEIRTYAPEFLTTFEVGFRSAWFDRRLTFNGNVFYSLYRDQQVVVPGPSGTFTDAQTINAGESTLYGAEFLIDYEVSNNFGVYGSLGLLQTEFDDFQFAGRNLAGNSFPFAPNVTFTVGADYEHSSGFFGNASLSYTGPQYSQALNLEEEDLAVFGPGLSERSNGRAIVNARAGFKHDNVTIFLYATNLFNDTTPIDALFTTVQLTGGDVVPREAPLRNVTEPRNFGVAVDLAF
ncbi:MAG: TonB-dependent receptor [Pseudomonadota bacterium]